MNSSYLRFTSYLMIGIMFIVCFSPAVASYPIHEKDTSSRITSTWLYVGGSGLGNYTNIQDAINAAVDGDTVYVYNGSYHEYIVISKSIRVLGENSQTTIIDGKGLKHIGVSISGSNASVENFTLCNHSLWPDDGAVRFTGDYNSILNCDIRNNRIAIYFRDNHNVVKDCNIYDNKITSVGGAGTIRFYKASHNILENCFIFNNKGSSIRAIKLIESNNNTITGCSIISHSGIGIYSYNSCLNNRVYNNNFILNGNNVRNSDTCVNQWDNGSVGNFWDDYPHKYPDAQNHSGIWSIPYATGSDDYDYYPLVSFQDFSYEYMPDVFPLAEIFYEPQVPIINETVYFDGIFCFDFKNITDYAWDFGDGSTATGKIVNHSYAHAGTYEIKLNVTNEYGKTDTDTASITISSYFCTVINLDTNETFYRLQSAIDDYDTRSGHTLFIPQDQICYENVNVRKSVTIQGEDPDCTIFDGLQGEYGFKISSSDVHITGLSIRNCSIGIDIDNKHRLEVDNNLFFENTYSLQLAASDDNWIHHNIFTNNSGTCLKYMHSNTDNNISFNQIVNNQGSAISTANSNYGHKIYKNVFENNPGSGVSFWESLYIDIIENKFVNMGKAVRIGPNCWFNNVIGNYIDNNEYGVHIEYNDKANLIQYNHFSNNTLGVFIEGLPIFDCPFNHVYNNNFINNQRDAAFVNAKYSYFLGNYWDRPRILPKFIIGKIGGFGRSNIKIDLQPALRPYEVKAKNL